METRRHKKEIKPAPADVALGVAWADWRAWLPQTLLIIAAGLWIYGPALTGGWLWDDDHYITENQIVQNPDGFWKVWVTEDWQGTYYPLNAFVEWLQWKWWGNDTFGYHLTNVALHLVSAFLIWRLLARLGLRLAWLGALLFVVHPVIVESVAWISELKNTLSLPPLLLAILAWLDWRDRGESRFYRNALLWFLISLLAKTSGSMLPFFLLGHSWWKNGTITRADLRAAAPFFVVALLPGLLTLFPGQGGNTASWPTHLNIVAALAAVGRTIFFLVGKCLLPVNLLPDYPSLAGNPPSWLDLLLWAAMALLALLLWRARAGWVRSFLLGLGFFFVNLAPVLVFVLLNYATMNWSMDHLVYLPIIGLIGLAVAGIEGMERHLAPTLRIAERFVFAAAIVLMTWGSHTYAGWFRDPETLWSNTLERFPTSWHATTNLSADMIEKGRTDEAMKYALQTLALRPDLAISHYNLGVAFEKSGEVDEAIDQYHETLRIEPANRKAIIDLGGVLRAQLGPTVPRPAGRALSTRVGKLNAGRGAVGF